MQRPEFQFHGRSKDFKTAQKLYEKCLKERQQDVTILSNLAAVHISLEKYAQALEYAQHGLKVEPNYIKCLYRCGVASTSLEQYSDAVAYLQNAMQQVSSLGSTLVLP